MPNCHMMHGRVMMSKGKVSKGFSQTPMITEEMVGKGKKEVSGLMLKIESPKRYISFK
jgi:hypothetical protein